VNNSKEPFSLIRGYSFTFEYKGHRIKAWFSALTGAEKVFVDGELVSSQRNFKRDTKNTFILDEEEYSTSLSVTSIIKGPFTCELLKKGIPVKRQHLIFPVSSSSNTKVIMRFLFYLLLGVGFGITQTHLHWPMWYAVIFIGIIFVIGLANRKKHMPIIKEESCD